MEFVPLLDGNVNRSATSALPARHRKELPEMSDILDGFEGGQPYWASSFAVISNVPVPVDTDAVVAWEPAVHDERQSALWVGGK